MSSESITRLTEAEAAKLLNVAPATLRNWRHRRKGPRYVKYSKHIYYLPEGITDYLRSCIVDPMHDPRRRRGRNAA